MLTIVRMSCPLIWATLIALLINISGSPVVSLVEETLFSGGEIVRSAVSRSRKGRLRIHAGGGEQQRLLDRFNHATDDDILAAAIFTDIGWLFVTAIITSSFASGAATSFLVTRCVSMWRSPNWFSTGAQPAGLCRWPALSRQ